MRLLSFLLCTALANLASADELPEGPAGGRVLDGSGRTLLAGEWKLGLGISSYGVTDRLQVDTAMVLLPAYLNAGVKYRLVDAPSLSLSGNLYAGASLPLLLVKVGGYFAGARLEATLPLHQRLWLNLGGGYQHWGMEPLGAEAVSLGISGLGWLTATASLEYQLRPEHTFLLTLGSPTSWRASTARGLHDFDALDFWQATVGYHLSRGVWNLRLDAGYGPGLLGRGLVVGGDLYLRF
jgi:hypothetical protein